MRHALIRIARDTYLAGHQSHRPLRHEEGARRGTSSFARDASLASYHRTHVAAESPKSATVGRNPTHKLTNAFYSPSVAL